MKLLVCIAIASLILIACGQKNHDFEYYVKHLAEADQALEDCKNLKINDMSVADIRNCRAAKEAIASSQIKMRAFDRYIKTH